MMEPDIEGVMIGEVNEEKVREEIEKGVRESVERRRKALDTITATLLMLSWEDREAVIDMMQSAIPSRHGAFGGIPMHRMRRVRP